MRPLPLARLAAALAFLLMAAPLQVPPAGGEGAASVVAAGEAEQPGWISLKVHSAGGSVTVTTHAELNVPAADSGIRWYGSDGELGGGTTITIGKLPDGTYVRTELGPLGERVLDTRARDDPSGATAILTEEVEVDGVAWLLLWTAGSVDRWNWSVTGAGAEVVGADAGPDARLLLAEDFESDAHVQHGDFPYGAQAVPLAEFRASFRHTPIVSYRTFPSAIDVGATAMAFLAPDGPRVCDCYHYDFLQPEALDPGEYTFHFSTARAGVFPGYPLLTVLDARLPP